MQDILESKLITKKRGWRQWFAFFVAMVVCFTLLSETVSADSTGNVKCTASGFVKEGQFFNPKLVYSAYVPGNPNANPKTTDYDGCGGIDAKKFFSGVSCKFLVSMNLVLSKFYCSFQFGMKEILAAVMTLFIVVYGAKLLMGLEEATFARAMVNLVKLGVVLMVVSNTYWGMGLIYDFFLNLMMDTVSWSVKSIYCRSFSVLDIPECLYKTNFTKTFEVVDSHIYAAIAGSPDSSVPPKLVNGLFSSNAELVALYIALAIGCFPLFMLAGGAIFTTFKFFVSTIVSTLLCLIVVTFLIALAPLFICFMLFGSTYNIFDNWIKHVISYTIQPMILFAIFAMWVAVAVDFVGFVNQLSKVIMYREATLVKGAVVSNQSADSLISVCRLRYTNVTSKLDLSKISDLSLAFKMGGPSITCCQSIDNPEPWKGVPYDYRPRICDPDPTKNYDTIEIATDSGPDFVGPPEPKKQDDWMRPSELIREGKFIYFMAYHLLTMLIVSYAFMNMITMAPKLAGQIAGSKGNAPLGTGFGTSPGLGNMVSQFSDWAKRGENNAPKAKPKAEQAAQATAGAAVVPGAPATAGLAGLGAKMATDPDKDPYSVGRRKGK